MLKKKFNIALLVVAFAILTLSFTAFAAEQEFKVTTDTDVTDGYTYSDGLLRFVKGGKYTIEMAEGVTQTTHKIEIYQPGIYNDTKQICLKFSNLNMITNTGDNIVITGNPEPIDVNIEIDGDNIITNTCVSTNNNEGYCIRGQTNSPNTTVKGKGRLILQAADDYPSWNGKTFTLDSDNVTLDFKNHAIMALNGIYIRSGNVDITSHEPCLYTNGEIIISGGKINATHTGEKTCVRSRGLEISGGDLSFSVSSSAPSAPKAVVAVDDTKGTKIGKSVNISGDASIMIDGAGKRVAGILLMKITDMFSMNGANLTIKNVTTGLYRSNAYSICTFSGGETEIITSAAAIYSAMGNNNYFLSFDDNYRHQTYEGSNEQERGLTDDDKLLKGTNRRNSRKYVLITPAYDITYNLDGGTVSPPNANPTRYTRVDNITLTNPTHRSKEFAGWTGSNGNVPQKNVTIPVGSKGDIVYKANWDNLPYSVYFYSNYEPGTYNTQTFKYDESEKLDANSFTRAGYAFTGWNTEGQPTTEKPGIHYDDQAELNISISNRLPNDQLVLWAQWNPIPAQPPTIINQPQNVDLIVGYSGGGKNQHTGRGC